MVIYRRQVHCLKPHADVHKIIQSSAHSAHCRIEKDSFSIRCTKRSTRGQMMLIPVKGRLIRHDAGTEVSLELCPGMDTLIGFAEIALGLILMLLHFLRPEAGRLAYGVMTIGMGLVITAFSWLRGIEMIDLLEHKLTR